MKFYFHVQNGKRTMKPEQARLEQQFLATLKPTDLVEADYHKYRQPRSQKQLGAWFGLFSKVVLAEFEDRGIDSGYLFGLNKPTGIAVSKGLLKDYMYAVCPCYNDDGKRITMSEPMNTIQMAQFFDDCRNWAATQWFIYVPDPDPHWYEKACQKGQIQCAQ